MIDTLSTGIFNLFATHPYIATLVLIILSLSSKYSWEYFRKRADNIYELKKMQINKEINTNEIFQKLTEFDLKINTLESEVEELKIKHTKNDEDIEDINIELTKIEIRINNLEKNDNSKKISIIKKPR